MKTARKLTSLLLALLLVFALAATAAADGGETGTTTNLGSITVENPITNKVYKAYKIFDVVYDVPTTTGHYSYTIDSAKNTDWFNTVDTYSKQEKSGLTLTPVKDTTTYVVTTTDDFSAPKFAAHLSKALKEATTTINGTELTAVAGGNPTASGLELGYYFVTSPAGALCSLDTTNPRATIYDKNDMPFNKIVTEKDVEVGKTVHYTITGKVPEHTAFTTYTYEITDKMSEGLTFDKNSVKVKINNEEKSAGNDMYTLDTEATDDYTFKVTINVKNYTVGQPIEVKYEATVNENAVAQISKNKAVLEYSNDPNNSVSKTKTPEREVEVYTSKIEIDKYQTGDEGKKLEGAEFVLYKRGTGITNAPTDKDYDIETAGNTTTYYPREYYQYTAATGNEGSKVGWVADKKQATHETTDNKGAASFIGLANGTYYLLETKAPAGYNQMTEAKDVIVTGSDTDATKLSVTAKVDNQAGTLLPSTGGMGTTVFYVLGAVLVLGAGVLLVTKKRMSRNEG